MDLAHYKRLAAELGALDARVNALLPPRYQHCYNEVSPTSMGSAGIIYGPDGLVAWDQIWTTFCDLALAGGPPHRGKLLEPASQAEVEADPTRYECVVAEIDRAIGLTSGFRLVESGTPGWIGVPCQSPEEAAWLQFAVTAENVSARRKKTVLLLPAGPSFRVEKEIKNFVVALAKACHYWEGHLTADQQTLAGDNVWEAATLDEASANRPDYEASADAVEKALHEAGQPTTPRRYIGWAGVETEDEEECVWLLRAVLADQVLARREDQTLYFPVSATPNLDRTARIGRAFDQACRLWTAYSSRLRSR